MTVTAQNLRTTMKKNEDKAEGRNVATLNSIERDIKGVWYSRKLDLYGNILDEISYEDEIYRGGEKENKWKSKTNDNKPSRSKSTYTPTPEERIASNINQLKKKTWKLTIANIEDMNTFTTVTMGDVDFYNLFSSKRSDKDKNELYLADQLSESELQLLKGKTNLKYKKEKDRRYLNNSEEENYLRKKIINILIKQASSMISKIEESFVKDEKTFKSVSARNQAIKRELASRINSLLSGKSPYNIENAYSAFSKFIENLKNLSEAYEGDFKYIAVLEFQENGRPHFHMLSNLKYLEQSKLQDKWGHGIAHISSLNSISRPGLHISKKDNLKAKATKLSNYLCEEISETRKDSRTKNRKILLRSNDLLKQPLEVITPELQRQVDQYVFSNSVGVDWESGLIEGKGEYSKSSNIKRRVMEDSNLYSMIEQRAGQLLDKILEIAEKLNSDIITKDIYYQAKRELFYKGQGYMPATVAA